MPLLACFSAYARGLSIVTIYRFNQRIADGRVAKTREKPPKNIHRVNREHCTIVHPLYKTQRRKFRKRSERRGARTAANPSGIPVANCHVERILRVECVFERFVLYP